MKIIFLFLFGISGWISPLFADCTEDETKALFAEEVMELKKKGFYGFNDSWGPYDGEIPERRFYFTARKKDGFGEEQVYGGMFVADNRVCDGLKDFKLEILEPLNILDFKKETIGTEEGCSLDRVKNIIYERMNKSDEYTIWGYPYGTIMKSWGYYEFIYIENTSDSNGVKYGEYLGRMEISKSSCTVKYDDVILIWAIWNRNFHPIIPSTP